MATLAIGRPPVSASSPRSDGPWLTRWPVATVLLVALALTALNPAGFIGGGGDEYQYLIAARCTAEHGFCLPHDHWWRRWPIVAPTAATLRLFGESYLTLALVPLGYALASFALLTAIVSRQFGRVPGTLAGVLFAVTPIVSEITLEAGIDMPEFLFALLALAAVQQLYRSDDRRMALLAGLAAGLAVQARPTSLTLLPVFVGLFAFTGQRRSILSFLLAAALPSAAEAIVYAATAGDPLLGWKLSLAHVRVPSTELLPTVDTRHSPLFNPDYIGGWRRPMDIHVHWLVDGLLNYLLHPAVAVTIMAALMMLVLEWRRIARGEVGGPALLFALALAVVWFGALTYGFAIDPKPRMFLLTLAAACTLFGVLAAQRWQGSRALVIGALVLVLGKGVIASYERFGLQAYAAAAPQMVAEAGPGLSVDPRTARFLALVPAVQHLPLFAGRADQRRMLLVGQASCHDAAREEGYAGWRPTARFAVPLREPAAVTALRDRRLFFSPAITPVMCVFARG